MACVGCPICGLVALVPSLSAAWFYYKHTKEKSSNLRLRFAASILAFGCLAIYSLLVRYFGDCSG